MANGKVDDLAWSQLRPRRSDPQCIVDSIPPEDMQTFLRLVATNPFLPCDDAAAIRRKIASLRLWRTDAANPNTITKEFSLIRPSSKRRREDHGGFVVNGYAASVRDTDSDDDQPKRKHRRSSRPALSPLVPKTQVRGDSPQSDDTPNIGVEFQADIPAGPMPRDFWRKHPPEILSKVVYDESKIGGPKAVDMFLRNVNVKKRRRDGFPLAPYAAEVALTKLYGLRGDPVQALKTAMRVLPRGPFFPGIKGYFKYEEQCIFVRSLAERSKEFGQISREILPHRSTSELVWMYYTRHKQLTMQNGGIKTGLVLDDGGEKLKRVELRTERMVSSLRNLATTAGDGFPVDSRVERAVLACRRVMVQQRKKARETEMYRRVPRLRNQNAPS